MVNGIHFNSIDTNSLLVRDFITALTSPLCIFTSHCSYASKQISMVLTIILLHEKNPSGDMFYSHTLGLLFPLDTSQNWRGTCLITFIKIDVRDTDADHCWCTWWDLFIYLFFYFNAIRYCNVSKRAFMTHYADDKSQLRILPQGTTFKTTCYFCHLPPTGFYSNSLTLGCNTGRCCYPCWLRCWRLCLRCWQTSWGAQMTQSAPKWADMRKHSALRWYKAAMMI